MSWETHYPEYAVPIEMTLDLLSSGMTFAEIMEDYPAIEESDILKFC
jgi:uncharacterized protein (DUF433 family)